MSDVAGAKILVVDDTPANVKLLVDVLDVSGYRACAATNGPEALDMIATDPPDLVLLDIMMPGMSGYEVCERLREEPATALLPVVLCTSLDPQQERIKGIEAGADDFITKPINRPELLARVKSTMVSSCAPPSPRQRTVSDYRRVGDVTVMRDSRRMTFATSTGTSLPG